MTVVIRTPGDAQNILVRFRNQRDASKPGSLRSAFMEATRGACRMKYPKTTEASDFYVMLCALANVNEDSTPADETHDWLEEYFDHGDELAKYTLRPEGRYDALDAMTSRQQFDRVRAQAYVRRDLDPGQRWVLFKDSQTQEQWVRVGEFAAFVRHVIGIPRIAQHTLDALMQEIGSNRVQFEVNRRHAGFKHLRMHLYGIST